ncbi:Aconitate hydratase 1 [Candidatus Cyrtobacter comes]|uniref:Aconitate hydratase n=1 Tax=Candidatus Cyrtobacter comes TaxID=675776 RepID=A0ABU5L9K4_9RICK|nr:aconitate hydratase AcnA [Candidatus Cyrtobacter comes]MDZ5762727.1 Aconitate hydratase 1 [Candidatus Cyrtobacter comes]
MINIFNSKSTYLKELIIGVETYHLFDIKSACSDLGVQLDKMPYSARVLLENLLRHQGGASDIQNFVDYISMKTEKEYDILFYPARVLMQDFTGVPAVVDLASMRDAAYKKGKDPKKINPLIPVDLVIDHSVKVGKSATSDALSYNIKIEMDENIERYKFLKWGQNSFENFRVVPPGTGICHQVNLEHLSDVISTRSVDGVSYIFPDTLVGTDSHTTMVNALSILGWGVGGIEAEAAMLGIPISMLAPAVVGVKLIGKLQEGVTATDLVLVVTNELRSKGVVGKFVEFYGAGIKELTLADRATISNMAPEYGATCGFFPIDRETIKYLEQTARKERAVIVEKYAKEQHLWYDESQSPVFHTTFTIDLSSIVPSMAGPKRPQDRVELSGVSQNFVDALPALSKDHSNIGKSFTVDGVGGIKNGSVVIAAITSCTNTSNPFAMIGAGLIAKKAVEAGLNTKKWVKTSLAPGSQVVTEYLKKSGLEKYLDSLGFQTVGYGCTTCIGNSGPLDPKIEDVISKNKMVVCSVLSGNRNFEGRVHSLVRANYLASPMLCVAYALVGEIDIDFEKTPIGSNEKGDVYLKDIWPSNKEINDTIASSITSEMFKEKYNNVFDGTEDWKKINTTQSTRYSWDESSTYVKKPPFFDNDVNISDIKNARILAILGDSITTDHISPAGSIPKNSPAGEYLIDHGINVGDFNSYGARRGNHEVMMRGTFANVRLLNELADGKEGGYTKHYDSGEIVSIFEASERYRKSGVPLIIIAGKEYGTGSSRDWAAKGTMLLGVKAVIAESFERIHRSNLIGMGVVPLQFQGKMNINGEDFVDIIGLATLKPKGFVKCMFLRDGKIIEEAQLLCRIDTDMELEYFKSGGILNYVLGGI